MNKLDEILKRKKEEIENRENKAAERGINRIVSEKIKQKELEEELKRKETEKIKLKELERIETINRRKKAILKAATENALSYGLIGLIIGAVLGFGKGCVSYSNSAITSTGYKPFLEPFRYILGTALIIGIIGVIIGILVGISKGQNS